VLTDSGDGTADGRTEITADSKSELVQEVSNDLPPAADLPQADPGGDGTADSACTDDCGGPNAAAFAQLEEFIEQERVARDIPGLAVAVLLDGKLAWAKGFGTKDPDGHVEIEPTTLFRIGSVTKMMTSTAMLQLEEAGAFNLSDPLISVLPDFTLKKTPEGVPEILLGQLLSHSAGLADFVVFDVPPAQCGDSALNDYVLGPLQFNTHLNAPPGRMYNYANPGYYIAGLVIEKGSGEFYKQYMKKKVWGPLGMNRTFFSAQDVLADGDFALGRHTDPTTGETSIIAPDSYDNGWAAPAGYVTTSVLDLALFAQFLLHGNPDVLSPAAHAQLMAKHVNTYEHADRLWYGYGITIAEYVLLPPDGTMQLATPVWHHEGSIPGFMAQLAVAPENGFGFIFVTSTDNLLQESQTKALGLFSDGLPVPTPAPDLSDDPSKYPEYAGDYMDPFNVGQITLSVEDAGLRLTAPVLDENEVEYDPVLVPISIRNYVWKVQGFEALLTILLDDNGQAEYLRTRFAVARRVPPDDRSDRQPFAFNPARLKWLLSQPAEPQSPW
jgi:CubicO group peptidase (beta-lactamase class C family)